MVSNFLISLHPSRGVFARIRGFWTELREAHAMATEFAALNALSDTDLARMGLTRACLKRHLRQKASAKVLSGPHGGWHERAPHHRAHKR
ncbi:hypothetical protein [Dinoroseobacter sp. S76]|uniref:hypothetical protein n=1 Tax=Dinoroseobacter sp. S76 TaxID=3415124 RepID=UPI003C79CA38